MYASSAKIKLYCLSKKSWAIWKESRLLGQYSCFIYGKAYLYVPVFLGFILFDCNSSRILHCGVLLCSNKHLLKEKKTDYIQNMRLKIISTMFQWVKEAAKNKSSFFIVPATKRGGGLLRKKSLFLNLFFILFTIVSKTYFIFRFSQ